LQVGEKKQEKKMALLLFFLSFLYWVYFQADKVESFLLKVKALETRQLALFRQVRC